MTKKIGAISILASIIAIFHPSFAAETTVAGRVYTKWMMDLSKSADSFNAFALERNYVDVKSRLFDETSLRVTSDFRTIDNKYDIILKYGYFDWRPSRLISIRMGLQPILYIDIMNKFWGRRFLLKTIGDEREFLT